MRAQGQQSEIISHSNFAQAAYWTISQLVAHHTVGGCALSAGDLFGTGTLSGKDPDQCGSLLEMSLGGKQGNGRQFVAWIHEADYARAVEFLIDREDMDGPVNIAAPNPLPNRQFMAALRSVKPDAQIQASAH